MVYIGNWVLNSTRGDDRFEDYDHVESKLFALCKNTPMEALVEDYNGMPVPSQAFNDGGIHEAIVNGLPVLGTCAGMILLAKAVDNDERARLATMDIIVRRNAYGRQLGSFHTEAPCKSLGDIPMTFIRAPYIVSTGEGVEVLATVDGNIVAARQDRQLVCSFHPELDPDTRFHAWFCAMCK